MHITKHLMNELIINVIEIIIGYPGNIPNPNSDGTRSVYEAEEVEKVKGEKAASGDASKEKGVAVGIR